MREVYHEAMNNLRIGLLAAIIGLVLAPVLALAAEVRVGDQPSTLINTTLADDLYMAGGSATSAGNVQGDVALAGGNVLISGNVSADILAAGGTVTILGTVGDDLRAGGGTIIVQGAVVDDVFIGGGQITLGGSGIGGDAIVGGGSVHIDAPIGGSLRIGGGEAYINAPVGGDVDVRAEKVTLGPRANIQGNFNYHSPSKATLEEGAIVVGETTYDEAASTQGMAVAGFFAFLTIALLIKFFAIFLSALVIASVFKRYTHELVVRAYAEPWSNLGWGLVAMIVLPILSVVLLFTLVGIPFGIIGLLAWVMILVFGIILAPIIIGAVVHKWIWKPAIHEVSWKTILLGTFIYTVLKIIPFIGGLVCFFVVLLAIGVVLGIKKEVAKEWR